MSSLPPDVDSVRIRSARAGEAGVLGRLIADSFAHLPVSRWLVADEGARRAAMGGQFEILVGHAMQHGTVDVVDVGDADVPTVAAVAVWFPPGPMADVADYDERLAAAVGDHLVRFVALDDEMHHRHPESPEHAYLAFLAVSESARDRGLGSALLRSHHELLDADGTHAYLEASGLRSRELYLRHGYADYSAPYGVGGSDGLDRLDDRDGFYPMWRSPTS
jgi:GNAT superfamily N-acetyltransferase